MDKYCITYRFCWECKTKTFSKTFCKKCNYSLCEKCLLDEYEIINNLCIICLDKTIQK